MSQAGEIVDATSSDEAVPETVLVGDDSLPVPIGLLQRIYSELTGRTASITDYFKDPILVGLEDIEQLDICIMQMLRQYAVKSITCQYTISYLERTKDEFNAFVNFRTQSAASSNPVESISVKYEFLIVPSRSRRPENYSLSIRVNSRLSTAKKIQQDFRGVPPSVVRIMAERTGVMEVRYIDYVVARTLQVTVSDWFKGLSKSPSNKFMKFVQRKSYWIPRLVRLVTVVMGILVAIDTLPHFISSDKNDLYAFGRFTLFAGLGLYVSYMLAGWLAIFGEDAVDVWSEISYVKLNKGDENQISESEYANRNSLLKAAGGLVASLAVGICTKVIAGLLVLYFAPH